MLKSMGRSIRSLCTSFGFCYLFFKNGENCTLARKTPVKIAATNPRRAFGGGWGVEWGEGESKSLRQAGLKQQYYLKTIPRPRGSSARESTALAQLCREFILLQWFPYILI